MASALEILESVSQWTAHHLDRPSVFAEHAKEQGYDPKRVAEGPRRAPFVLKRGYDEAVKGRRALVVDDVVNTGLSVRETAGAAEGVPVNTRYAHGADFLAQQAGG